MWRWPRLADVPPRAGPGRGPARAAALTVLVALAHLWLADRLVEDRFGWGQGETASRRMDVSFVKELAPAAPPPALLPAAASVRPAGPPRLAAVASAPLPEPVASAPTAELARDVATTPPPAEATPGDPATAVAAAAPASEPLTPTIPAATADAAALPASSAVAQATPAADGPARFDWPPSTRLSYLLLGNYRGPVEGRAQVEWLRSGMRYQVHLEASVAPFLSRRVSSEGELTDQGLAPRLTTGEQRVLLRTPRRWTLRFTPEKVVLTDGREADALPGAQDEASQFVQLTWLFTTQPALLQVGKLVEMPLALSRRLEVWIFEVKAQELLRLPFGEVETFHVKPRREVSKGSDMVAQMWFAPSLQYLPVRILIHQDAETWIDLQLEKPPLQAAR